MFNLKIDAVREQVAYCVAIFNSFLIQSYFIKEEDYKSFTICLVSDSWLDNELENCRDILHLKSYH